MNNTDINGKHYNRSLMVAVLLIGSFCTVLNQTILSTAFPTLMNEFDVSTSTIQWLTTGFMLVNGVMIPVSAWLITRFKTKLLYLSAMITFLIGTIVCFVATNFPVMLTGRLIQALGVGLSMPLLQTIMLTIFPASQRGTAMGMAGIVIGVAPAIGPTLSGWVIDNLSWRDLFGMIIPIVIIVIIMSLFFMKNVIETTKNKLDVLSFVMSTAGFGALLYGFSTVGDKGWSSLQVIVPIIAGIIFIVMFGYRQLHLDKPFLELRVFKQSEFAIAAALSSVTNMAMVGVEMILPMYLQIVKGLSAFHSGLALLAGAVMMAIMSPITGRAFDKYGVKRLATTGMLLLTIGTIPFFYLTKDSSTLYLTVLYAVRMFGISMVMMPVTTSGMNSLPNNLISHGTAVNNTTRQVFSSMGTAVLISVLSNVTNKSMPAKHLLKEMPLVYKDSVINATLTGYHAAFLVAALFCVTAVVLTFFLKSKKNDTTVKGAN
ncbi:MFS transporter [Companilactobacillus sp. RD055328]|uniref:MDR family MFS transporter n=1 Tax=Companilactobacillus sp. RD055328 TaxID=2916634 RepID=UPI001FC85C01|nr:MDR family MFS transporter [Companilactobacillus sp. RD055328]GKQ42334.1 MFS transporter [Companilactobacillus sp. RD055328]